MPHQQPRFTESIGLKVTVDQYQTLSQLAENDSKPIGEWCRDTLAAIVRRGQPSSFEFALMAEITATQAILIDMLCAVGRDGKITTQKAQQIVDAAHNNKYKEALELLRFAYSKAAKFRLDGWELLASGDGHVKGGSHE